VKPVPAHDVDGDALPVQGVVRLSSSRRVLEQSV